MDAGGLHVAHHVRLEESLGAAEPLIANLDDLPVRKLVGLLNGVGSFSSGHLLIEVKSDVAELLLDVPHDLQLGGGGEGVLATLRHQLLEVPGEVPAGQVQPVDGVGESVTLVDGDGVRDTVTGVHDDTSGTAGGVQGEDSLDGDVHGGSAEGLEHDLSHLLSVALGVEGSLSQKDGVLKMQIGIKFSDRNQMLPPRGPHGAH